MLFLTACHRGCEKPVRKCTPDAAVLLIRRSVDFATGFRGVASARAHDALVTAARVYVWVVRACGAPNARHSSRVALPQSRCARLAHRDCRGPGKSVNFAAGASRTVSGISYVRVAGKVLSLRTWLAAVALCRSLIRVALPDRAAVASAATRFS